MSWKCPECGSSHNNSIISCTCGYEKGMATAPRLELLQTTFAEDTENKEIKVYKGGILIEKFFKITFFCLGLIFIGGAYGLLIKLVRELFVNKKYATTIDILSRISFGIFFLLPYFRIIDSIVVRPCPACGVWRAGEKQMEEGSQIFLKCKYCGHEWIIEKVDHPPGGG